VQAAYDKANETGVDMAWQNAILPFKTMAAGTASGFIVGCVTTAEGGCIEGAIPGALTGAMGGLILGSARSIYGNITGYFKVRDQLQKDLAACSQNQSF
jgi:hypothetical protein